MSQLTEKAIPLEWSAEPSVFPSPPWLLVFTLLSYRQKMPVREVRIFSSSHGKTGYYICPRCSITMERDFMSFCDRCGQRLGWKGYRKAKKIYSR